MEFVVLARKLRPARFEHLIGQDTVVRALRNAILTDRVAHAFLFAGSRGVGKTSTARILTKALNCERPAADGEPCNECSNCREITLNTSPDVYEIDAASNRGIDNIRELRENTKYAPVKSRYKTYIIDEVHMLTMESFNALLKTLEEPPPHVKFILATTNPHRIPDTILSRCQRYDFARVPVPVLSDYLASVTAREGITLSRHALETIARNAAGGVRDALTAIDQVVTYAGQQPSDAQVLSILGLADAREVLTLLGAILDKTLPAALETAAAIREHGHDLGVLLEALIREVKDFSLYFSLAGNPAALAERPPDTLAFFAERRKTVSLDELQQLFYLLLEVEQQIKRSDFAQACFEMGLVKACRVEPLLGVRELLGQVRSLLPREAAAEGAPPAARAGAAPPSPPTGAAASPAALPASAPPVAPTTRSAPPPDFASIAARGQARAREAAGASARRVSGSGGERGAPEDADEPEPAAATPAPLAAPLAAPSAAPPALPRPRPTPPAAPAAPVASPAAAGPGEAAPTEPTAPTPPPLPDAADGDDPPLCDDPRWRGLVEALGEQYPRLASKLRRAEVLALAAQEVLLLPADAASRPSAAELETLAAFVREAFGDAFHIRPVDDTRKKARETHSIAGRNRSAEAARIAARRTAAEQDAQVQRLLHYFPKGRIVEIALSDPPGDEPHPNRNDDV